MTDLVQFWRRRCEVTLVADNGESKQYVTEHVPGEGFVGLQVEFDVKKTSTSTPNEASVTMTNLSPATRGWLSSDGGRIVLAAGYESSTAVLFAGDIVEVNNARKGAEWTTELECGDYQQSLVQAYSTTTFSPGVAADQVWRKLAQDLDAPIADGSYLPDGSLRQGFSTGMLTKEALDRLAQRYGLDWHIEDGEMVVRRAGQSTGEEAYVLSSDSGMVGSPESGKRGWKVKSLLNPDIKPGRQVRVESQVITDNFVTRSVGHKGDTHGSDWYTTLEVRDG